MRATGVATAVFAILAASGAAAGSADPTGYWLTEDGSAVVRIAACGPSLCGTIVWSQKPVDAKGRALCGLAVLGDATKTGVDSWGRGWIYSPKADEKFPASLKLAPDGFLQIHISAGLFGRDQAWTRPTQTVTSCVP